ncbi:50S ribosomal protein L31 [Streptomyces fuscigenes]|uniref:50S ribosomal protein L31 n=1 Tax=Streptomyces fuscigenes TaxID=1528880 RepID=UPI001F365C37|nr:50S ribosomal protein L31 [Streptomyces fuscigenes]MCF3960668.1 50S ribosomal protein L31 [Streptomyces fuscigenes]
MKPETHPAHRPVVQRGRPGGSALPTRSTTTGDRTTNGPEPTAPTGRHDGRIPPVAGIETPSEGHPVGTQTPRVRDSAARADRFGRREGQGGGRR